MTSELMVYIAIGAGSVAAVAVIAVLTRLAWRRQVRRYVVTLIGGQEDVRTALSTVHKASGRLAEANDGELIAFALGSGSDERRTFADIAERMDITAEELQTMALPKGLWPVANTLADAAVLLGQQAGRVSSGVGLEVLDALGEIDLVGVVSLLEASDAMLSDLRERYRVADDIIYGGGLYI
ncbi:MAG: hypothetical protein Q7J82_05020 [Coriobacteriia bacterium]|nr:hypothetical protein [Coriobacteriia bacterium]